MKSKFRHKTLSQIRADNTMNIAVKAKDKVLKRNKRNKKIMTTQQIDRYGELRDKLMGSTTYPTDDEISEANALSKHYVEHLKAGGQPAFDLNINTVKQLERPKKEKWKMGRLTPYQAKMMFKEPETEAEKEAKEVAREYAKLQVLKKNL